MRRAPLLRGNAAPLARLRRPAQCLLQRIRESAERCGIYRNLLLPRSFHRHPDCSPSKPGRGRRPGRTTCTTGPRPPARMGTAHWHADPYRRRPRRPMLERSFVIPGIRPRSATRSGPRRRRWRCRKRMCRAHRCADLPDWRRCRPG